MAKLTLLDMVQSILNDMDGDQVNTINDTFESEQVAVIVRDTFRAITSNRDWALHTGLIQLTASGDVNFPTYLTVPENVKKMLTINYDKSTNLDPKKRYSEVTWAEPDEFLRLINGRDSTATNVQVVIDSSGVELMILNDRPPNKYTSFDDNTVVFDSFDNAVETTIQQSKVQARAVSAPSWTHEDTFIPKLPDEAFTLLLEEAKSRAFNALKQIGNSKAEQESGRQNRWLARNDWRVKGGIKYPDYGRRRVRTVSTRTNFEKSDL